jgi:outer membrane protein assembly factor BamB/predicted phosphodiesterase
MKKRWLLFILLIAMVQVNAQWKPFRFAFISDTHIGSPNGSAEEDLRRTVADINSMNDIAFVVLTGDITELGTDAEIKLAKEILAELKVPYYIIAGNHDTGWSESGGVSFGKIFGYDKFSFNFNGIQFIGCASGPYVRMSDGHIPRDAVNWLDLELKKLQTNQPVVFLNHYPLDKDLDNWYEAVDRLKNHRTLAVLNGHWHTNRRMQYEDLPAVVGRSNLRAKAAYGGYNLVDVRLDSMIFAERTPGIETKKAWTGIDLSKKDYSPNKKFYRPDYSMNDSFPSVKARWVYASDANVISTPAVTSSLVIFGNSLGSIDAISKSTGKKKWSYQTKGAIYSSPAIVQNKVVVASGDGSIYCLNSNNGKLIWQFKAEAAVLGSPLIHDNKVYIGGSDHHFRCIDLATGKQRWSFGELDGPVVSTPVFSNGKIIFGSWDRHLYALDAYTGSLSWKWNNGSMVRNFAPASCIPVVQDDIVYIVAPDRFLTAIDLNNGNTLWRTKEVSVRESIGISVDGKWLYCKTMSDGFAVFPTGRTLQTLAWKKDFGIGYEHVPNMPIEKEGKVYFGTKNGIVYGVDPYTREKLWRYRIDNSMVNTINLSNANELVAATMDGKVTLLDLKY